MFLCLGRLQLLKQVGRISWFAMITTAIAACSSGGSGIRSKRPVDRRVDATVTRSQERISLQGLGTVDFTNHPELIGQQITIEQRSDPAVNAVATAEQANLQVEFIDDQVLFITVSKMPVGAPLPIEVDLNDLPIPALIEFYVLYSYAPTGASEDGEDGFETLESLYDEGTCILSARLPTDDFLMQSENIYRAAVKVGKAKEFNPLAPLSLTSSGTQSHEGLEKNSLKTGKLCSRSVASPL